MFSVADKFYLRDLKIIWRGSYYNRICFYLEIM